MLHVHGYSTNTSVVCAVAVVDKERFKTARVELDKPTGQVYTPKRPAPKNVYGGLELECLPFLHVHEPASLVQAAILLPFAHTSEVLQTKLDGAL